MASRGDQAPLTRSRKKEAEQNKRDAKRRKTLFIPRKVIGPNDIAVNLAEGKIKLEVQDIKQEVGEEVAEDSGRWSNDQMIDRNLEGNAMEMEHSVLVIKQESDDTGNTAVSIQEEIRLSDAGKDARILELEQHVKDDKGKITSLEEKISQLEKRIKEGLNPKPSSSTLPVTKATSEVEKPEKFANPKGNKVIWLFPQVAQTIWKKYRFSYFRRQDFLSARLVHSTWKNGVDGIPQGPFQFFHDDCSVSVDISNYKDVNEKLVPLMQTRLSSQAYPKVSKLCLKFEMEESESLWQPCDKKEMESVILTLLTTNGPNIISFEHSIGSQDWYEYPAMFEDTLDWFRTLIDWLVLMPNLKELTLTHVPEPLFPQPTNVKTMFSLMEEQVMLGFDKLKRINFVTVPGPVIMAILGKSNQLIDLHLELTHMSFAPYLRQVPRKSNLCLQSQLKRISMKFDHPKCFDILFRLGLELVSLQTLKLTWEWRKEWIIPCFKYQFLCQILNELRSLVDVQLAGNLYFGNHAWNRFPGLSNLRKLKLVLSFNDLVSSMQLFSKMPALTELKVIVPLGQPHSEREYKDRMEMFVCDLWNLLPKLEPVTIFTCQPDYPFRRISRLTFKYTRSVHQTFLQNLQQQKPREVWLQPGSYSSYTFFGSSQPNRLVVYNPKPYNMFM